MTRSVDAVAAASLGARYIGCIFAGGPRHQSPRGAAAVFADVGTDGRPQRVGVFAEANPRAIVEALRSIDLDVIQVHGAATPSQLTALRQEVGQRIWAVVRCVDGTLPPEAAQLWDVADAVLLDTHAPDRLGGTGIALPWRALDAAVRASRERSTRCSRLILAGGLTAENVGEAIAALEPDAVDTSSGVESAPGIKDFSRMAAFVEAVDVADRALGRGRKLP